MEISPERLNYDFLRQDVDYCKKTIENQLLPALLKCQTDQLALYNTLDKIAEKTKLDRIEIQKFFDEECERLHRDLLVNAEVVSMPLAIKLDEIETDQNLKDEKKC